MLVVQDRLEAYLPPSVAQVLRSRPDTDEARRNLPQDRKVLKKPWQNRQRSCTRCLATGYNVPVNESLHMLDQTRRPFAASLHFRKISNRDRTASQFFCQQIRRGDRILNREINSNAAGR